MVEENLVHISLRWSASDDMDHSVCRNQLEDGSVNDGK